MSHALFVDLDDNSRVSAGDIISGSGLDVVFTFTVPNAPGSHVYYCSIHSASGYGGPYNPGAPMYGLFNVNGAPKASFAAPTATASWTGGSAQDIRFNLQDEDPPTSLTVWVNYSHSGGLQGGPIAGPMTGTTNPNVVVWTPPRFNATDVVIEVTGRDTTGVVGRSRSPPFEIDSTPPTIAGRLPAPNSANVPVNSHAGVTWSEPMSKTASGAANAFALQRVSDGAWISGAASWSTDATQMTFTPSAWLDPTTNYRIVVNATAMDDSAPGNPFAGSDTWQFTTGSGAAPTGVIAQVFGEGTIHVVWSPVTGGTVAGYNVYRATATGGPFMKLTSTMVPAAGPLVYVDTAAQPGITYYYVVTAVDSSGNESPQSSAASATLPGLPATTDTTVWIIVGAAAAVAAVAAGAIVVVRRRRKP